MSDNIDNNKRKKQQENRDAFKMITLISQFGINMLVPIFLCFFVGLYLDKYFGTSFIMIILFFIGAIAGFRNVYVLAMRMTKKSDKEKLIDEINNTQKNDK